MKATRDSEFKPVTLVIETEEEAKMLWCMLGCGSNQTLEEFIKSHKEASINYSLRIEMFRMFDKLFTLKK